MEELEALVDEHDKILNKQDERIGKIENELSSISLKVNESLVRVEESNKFLREQNTAQLQQNGQILNAVLQRNEESDKRKHEFKMFTWSNFWKLTIAVGGAGGFIAVLIDKLWN